ncbi:MAG TPA: HAMP domain-containing sensor histidine kinase [Verrucomicrobiae bacterium]
MASAFGLLAASEAMAAPATTDVVSPTLITNLNQFWSLPATEKNQLHHARMELLVYYCNPDWGVFWGRSDDLDTFLPFRGIPVALKSGDKVLLDGVALPVNEEFLWDKTSVKILSESNSLPFVSGNDRLFDTTALEKHMVQIDALVDSQTMTSANMLRLNLLAQDFNVEVYVPIGKGDQVPALVGKFVRITGVYSETFDIDGKVATITFWSPGLNYVKVTSSLDDDPRFSSDSIPLTTSDDFGSADSHAMIRVQGVVRSQQSGQEVTIWDAAGQIRILTKQQQLLQINDHIEAIGYPALEGIDRVLQDGIFRVTTNTMSFSTNQTELRLAAEVRSLDQESLDRHLPVNLEGVVTWVSRGQFSYIMDSSGGIRVFQTSFENKRPMRVGMVVKVNGVTAQGRYAPVITNAVAQQTGDTSLPDAPLVSLAEAMTGSDDGRWIQMRGYVRRVNAGNNSLRLRLVASDGNFSATVPADNSFKTLQGSVVLVKGVCVANADSRRQLTGIEIWSPQIDDVQIEQSPPADLFALPMHPLASLRQYNPFNTLDERVRTSGTVTLAVPGRYLYIQDGDSGLLAFSELTNALAPGDRVEVVGFCGNEGGGFLLREAVYRRISSGADPAPLERPSTPPVSEDLDALLVRSEGQLLDLVERKDETDLIIQAKDLIFQATLYGPVLPANQFEIGSRLSLTGVYRIQRDEYGAVRAFQLTLRDIKDVQVLKPPPWWTLSRLLWVLAGAALIMLVAIMWALQSQHRSVLLLQSQAELKTARDKLEERVRERTRELSEQVKARELANERLSEAQSRLMVASRQAGMAEMATSVLHNVGNVLNSVNVSASVIGDSVQQLRIENLAKAIALLNEGNSNPVHFLTEDPRGRALPGYLRDLAGVMMEKRKNLQDEVDSLIKQIDHVKAIVALQQDYVKNSNIAEILNPADVMEDAFAINRDAYERHQITIVRQYDNSPQIVADRHKVLQILINLLSNAKYALAGAAKKQVTFRICSAGPEHVHFEISDTGMGIAPENLERIFMLGFTTRPGGHGFGLHSGANAATEMDGRLFVLSDGAGHGATFVLELPAARQPLRTGQVGDSLLTKPEL